MIPPLSGDIENMPSFMRAAGQKPGMGADQGGLDKTLGVLAAA